MVHSYLEVMSNYSNLRQKKFTLCTRLIRSCYTLPQGHIYQKFLLLYNLLRFFQLWWVSNNLILINISDVNSVCTFSRWSIYHTSVFHCVIMSWGLINGVLSLVNPSYLVTFNHKTTPINTVLRKAKRSYL